MSEPRHIRKSSLENNYYASKFIPMHVGFNSFYITCHTFYVLNESFHVKRILTGFYFPLTKSNGEMLK